mgnify:CR=1 FL=1
MKFKVNGEYGYELFAALPLINWYKEQGNDVVVDGVVKFTLSKYKSK